MSNNRTNLKCLVIFVLCVAVMVTLPSVGGFAEGRKTGVLIFPIKTEGVVLSLAVKKSLLQYLGTRLTMEGVFSVMPESQLKMDLGAVKVLSYQECYDTACQIQLGKAVAADKSLSVQVMMVDKECCVIATLFDLVQEMSESGAEAVGGCKQGQIMESLKSVAAQLSGKMVDVSTGGSGGAVAQRSVSGAVVTGKTDHAVSLVASQMSTTGILAITGSPDGALVEISGPAEFGRGGRQSGVLPLNPLHVPAGSYTVRFTAKDYGSEDRTVWVYPGVTAEVSAILISNYGQIELTGQPAGAIGKLVCQMGHKADVALPGTGKKVMFSVPKGECRLTVNQDGYFPFDQVFPVDADKVAGLDVELRLDVSGTKWVQVPGGSFSMGSNDGERDEQPVHLVNVQSFLITETEVTVAQYQICLDAGVCGRPGTGGACNWGRTDRKDHPINCVDWNQANTYAKWVGGRLPTEAEWEYAARAGSTGDRYGVADLVAWYNVNSGGQTQDVGQKQKNGFGLNDMIGNVWEYCQDWYHSSYTNAPSNGKSWESPVGSMRVGRGGSWANDGRYARAAYRFHVLPSGGRPDFGFRPVRPVL